MGSPEVSESLNGMNGDLVPIKVRSDGGEKEDPGEFLNSLDSYFDDINDRLIILRLVNDSVIKGMISAIESESDEKIADKELELDRLRKMSYNCNIREEKNKSFQYSMVQEPENVEFGFHLDHSHAFTELDNLLRSLVTDSFAAKEQLRKIRKEIDKVRGSNPIRRKGSNSELHGSSGILQEELPDKCANADKAIDGLTKTLNNVCKQAENMVQLSDSSLLQSKQEMEFQTKIERMVINNCVRCFQEELEKTLWEQNSHSRASEIALHIEKIKEISSLRQELDSVSKSLAVAETEQLISHGSLERRKASDNHASVATSHREGNGKHDSSIIINPENIDLAQLKHLSKDELATYLKTEMIKMKRQHELIVQEMTEDMFSLKRDYLRDRRTSLLGQKDKELDGVRKKIPDLIMKLDNILTENEKLPAISRIGDGLDYLKHRLDVLLSENHQLRDLLAEKKEEINLLSVQLSEVREKMRAESVGQANLTRTIINLKRDMEDSNIESLVFEDVNRFLLKEAMSQIKCTVRESEARYDLMERTNEDPITEDATIIGKLEVEDSDIELVISQGVLELIYIEALHEVEERWSNLNLDYEKEKEVRLSLEKELLEKEKELKVKLEERDQLELEVVMLEVIIEEKEKSLNEATDAFAQEKVKLEMASQELVSLKSQTNHQNMLLDQLELQVVVLEVIIEEKEKSLNEATDAFAQEKVKLEMATQELGSLKSQTNHQNTLLSQSIEEKQIVKRKLDEAMEKINVYEWKISELGQSLEAMSEKVKESTEEKKALSVLSDHKQVMVLEAEEREKKHHRQMKAIVAFVRGLSETVNNMESRITDKMDKHYLRLKNLSTHCVFLTQQANNLRATGLSYKQKFEQKCSDLQKAEAEVDLLGDQVDTLSGLLEKIYIALDHYSPILKHYPGIIEILKMVRRELSGESIKSV